jgi:hypothetical protein
MRGQMTHLDTDVLAEFRAGLITGRRGAKITAHLAGCDRCTALDDQLAGVSALLASVPAPPMPDSVAQRLEVVLAAEVTSRNYPERAQVARPGDSGAHDRPPAKRGFRLATWRVLAPAGAAVVLAAGGFGLSQIAHGPGSHIAASSGAASTASSGAASTASSAAGGAAKSASRPGAAAMSPAPSAHSEFRSGNQPVDVSRATLRQQVETELHKPRASRPVTAASSQVRGCVHLLVGSDPLELVQRVQFEGQPATIIVARTGQGYTAWVAGPDCSATNREVLETITLPSGISAP